MSDEVESNNLQQALIRLVVRLSYGVNEYDEQLLELLADLRKEMEQEPSSEKVDAFSGRLGEILGDIHFQPERSNLELPYLSFSKLLAAPRFPAEQRKQLLELAVELIKEKGSLNAELWHRWVAEIDTALRSIEDEDSVLRSLEQAENILLALLDDFELPTAEARNIDLVKGKLRKARNIEELVECIGDIHEMISRYHDKTARKDLEEFLLEMRQNLTGMQSLVAGLLEGQNLSFRLSTGFGRTLEKNIAEMNLQIDSAADLDSLKLDVKNYMSSLSSSLEKFSRETEERKRTVVNEFKQVNARMNALEIVSEVLREKLANERKQATLDALTGVHNRQAYDERIVEEIDRYQRYETPFVLSVWDLDKFKYINDTYGHLAGDKVLQATADLLKENLRRVDFISRYGGEEFVVIMPNTQLASASKAANKIRTRLQEVRFHRLQVDLDVTISCGLAEVRLDDTADSLFNRADAALYRAKHEGRNLCVSAE